jgi:hypothetical protein
VPRATANCHACDTSSPLPWKYTVLSVLLGCSMYRHGSCGCVFGSRTFSHMHPYPSPPFFFFLRCSEPFQNVLLRVPPWRWQQVCLGILPPMELLPCRWTSARGSVLAVE